MTDLVYQAEQVQQLLRCAICLDRFHHPKLLPCQHTFCETPCLEGLIDHYTRRVRCPECRLEHRVPINGTAGFPNNLTIIGFLDLPHQAAALSGGSTSAPQGGQSSPVVTEISHPEPRPRDNAPLAQLEYHTPSGQAMCSDCGRIAVLNLCTHCNEQICEVCRHSHVSSLKLEISRQLQRIRRALPNMSESLSSVDHRREQLRRMCDSVKCVILDTIERFIRDLKIRQDHLYSEIDEFLFAEIRCLQEYQENLELELTSIVSFCDNTEPLLSQRPDIESSNIDLQDIKRQGQEHVATLQNQVSLELPTARQLTFQDDSTRLSPAITQFGELMVMIQNNSSSSYIRNSVLGYSDSVNRTYLRDYNPNRESPRSSTAPSPRSHSSAIDSSSTYRRSDSSHSTRGSGSSASTTPTTSRSARTEVPPVSSPSSTSAAVRFASSTPSALISSPTHSRYSAATSSAGLLTSSRRELGGLPSSYLDRDIPDEPSRHQSGPGAASVPSSSSESLFGTRREEPTSGASSGTRSEYPAQGKPKDKGTSKEKRASPPRGRRQQQEMVPYSDVSRPSTSSGAVVPSAAGASNESGHVYRSTSPTLYERRSLPNSPNSARRDPELLPDNEIFPSALTWHPRSENLPRFGGHSRGHGHYYTHNMTPPSSANWMESFGSHDRYSTSRPPAANTTPTPRRRPEALTYLHPGETDESSTSTENDLANERRHSLALTRTEGEIYSSSDEEDYADETAAPGYRHCKTASTIVSQARNNYQAKHRSWTRFGEQGSGESQFMAPRGVAASPEDEIYICDSSNHRIQVFDNTGIFVQSFGCYGQGNDEFDCTSGVAVNNFGHIAVSDRYNNRVQLFDRHGRFQTAFGNIGSNDGEMKTPWGITWDNMGFIYVCDKENNRVQVFQANGNFVRKFGRHGHGQPGTFNSPHYVAVSPENLIYVTDSNNHRIQVFSIYGDFLFGFGGEGTGRGQLCNPRGISIDDQGFVVIADCGNHRVQVFRGDGRFYSAFGTWGEQPNQFKSPEGVTVMTNGAIAVTDRENNRVQLF